MSFFKFFQKATAPAEDPAAAPAPVIDDENEVTPEKLERKHLFEQLRKAIQRVVGYAAEGSVITNEIDNEVGLTEALSAILDHKMKGFRANRLLSVSVLLELALESLPPTIKIPAFGKELRDSSLLVKNKAWIVYCLNNHVMYATIDIIVKDFACDSYEEAGILSYPETSVMILGLIAPLDDFDFELSVDPTPSSREGSSPSTPVVHQVEHSAAPAQPLVTPPKSKLKSGNSHSMTSLPTEEDGIVVAKTKKVRKKTRPAQQHAQQAEGESEKKDEIIAGLEKQIEDLKKENSTQKNTITLQQKEIMLLKKKIAMLEKSLASAEERNDDHVGMTHDVMGEEEEVETKEKVEEETHSIPVSEERNNEVVEDFKKDEEIVRPEPVEEHKEDIVPAKEEVMEEEKVVETAKKEEEKPLATPEPYNPFESEVSTNIEPAQVVEERVKSSSPAPSTSPVVAAPVAPVSKASSNNLRMSSSEDIDDFVILPRENGTFKNGMEVDKKFERVVTKIFVRALKSVQYISFEFSDGKTVSQGIENGEELSITLKPGQYVNAIYGRKNQQSLERLLIKFNVGEPFGPFGTTEGPDTFAFYAEENEYLYDINIVKAKKLFSQEPSSVVPVWKTFKK